MGLRLQLEACATAPATVKEEPYADGAFAHHDGVAVGKKT